MAESWENVPVGEVQPGSRIRLANGVEVQVSRVDANFLGRAEMVCFIEDTPERWFAQPMRLAGTVDVRRPG
jgi:hypothetical protein